MYTRILVGSLKGRDKLKDMDIDLMIILKCILKNRMGGRGVNLCGSVDRPVAGACEQGDEPRDYLG